MTVDIRYSNDGGENYGNWRELSTGSTGSFLVQLIARRLGMCRHRVWEFRDASSVAQDVLGAEIIMEGE